MENDYIADLTDFNSQVSATETAYANANHFNVGTWRQWDAAAPRVTATATAVLSAPEDPNIPAGLTNVVAIAAGGGSISSVWRSRPTARSSAGEITPTASHRCQTRPPYFLPAGDIAGQLTNVVAIAAGDDHSLALKADGTVVGWGDNFYGEITIPAGLTNVVAIAAGGYHSLALKADGTVVGWGDNNYGEINIPAGLTNVVAIAAGDVSQSGAQGRRHGRRLGR